LHSLSVLETKSSDKRRSSQNHQHVRGVHGPRQKFNNGFSDRWISAMIGGITILPLIVLLFLPIIFANIGDLIIAIITIYYTGFVHEVICSYVNTFRCLKCPNCRKLQL